MKKISIVLLALLVLAPGLASADVWTGWITDASCGAKGAKAEHKDCARKCMENGDALVFYNTADEKIYKLDKQDVAKEHLGHVVRVTGSVAGDAITVEKIEKGEESHSHH